MISIFPIRIARFKRKTESFSPESEPNPFSILLRRARRLVLVALTSGYFFTAASLRESEMGLTVNIYVCDSDVVTCSQFSEQYISLAFALTTSRSVLCSCRVP